MRTKDQQRASQVSKMLVTVGTELLDAMRQRQPEIVEDWATNATGDLIAKEGIKLAEHFRPERKARITDVLEDFSLERMLSDAEEIAPTLCKVLRRLGKEETESERSRKKHVDIVRPVLSI